MAAGLIRQEMGEGIISGDQAAEHLSRRKDPISNMNRG
jgi:hypothetical protein